MSRPRFHLAFPVRDLTEARRFYGSLLGCPEGRSSPEWVDFDFYGHQIVAHLCDPGGRAATKAQVSLSVANWTCLQQRTVPKLT